MKPPRFGKVDMEMFVSECKALKPSPPLVFALELQESARNHSHYMNLNGQTHYEDSTKRGYTGASPSTRASKAGYKGLGIAENCFAKISGIDYAHRAFVIDWGSGGPGGMQRGRGHRSNLTNYNFNVVGIGCVNVNGSLKTNLQTYSCTQNFGSISGRYVGGVAFADTNGNGFYDIGEGLGGVTIETSNGNAKTMSWPSGAYALKLPDSNDVTLVAYKGEGTRRVKKDFSSGTENVKFDYIIGRHDGKIDADNDKAKNLAKTRSLSKDVTKKKENHLSAQEPQWQPKNLFPSFDFAQAAAVKAYQNENKTDVLGDTQSSFSAIPLFPFSYPRCIRFLWLNENSRYLVPRPDFTVAVVGIIPFTEFAFLSCR